MKTNYDYIIAGAGCAGLSLLYRMMLHPFFRDKEILVIEQTEKKVNDRTWCFWENGKGFFEELVRHRWPLLDFHSRGYSSRLNVAPYEYKMIRGVDLYEQVLSEARSHSNIHVIKDKILSLQNEGNRALAVATSAKYSADYLFNSILFRRPAIDGHYNLLQHFKGWTIKTPLSVFESGVATFMDFRISQEYGAAFVYVLPLGPDTALVEYTLITEQTLPPELYDRGLKEYIERVLQIKDYFVIEEEFGVIPMTSAPFSRGDGRVINIGTAGGRTKSSSGFTFSFIQKHSEMIVETLMKNNSFPVGRQRSRFTIYDNILLNILYHKKMDADRIFADLFRKNNAARVLRFLDNDTNLFEELQIMASVPSTVFLPVAFRELVAGK